MPLCLCLHVLVDSLVHHCFSVSTCYDVPLVCCSPGHPLLYALGGLDPDNTYLLLCLVAIGQHHILDNAADENGELR